MSSLLWRQTHKRLLLSTARLQHPRLRTYADAAPLKDSIVENATPTEEEAPRSNEAWLFVSSVFPIRVARFDLRYLIGFMMQDRLLDQLRERLAPTNVHGFEIISMVPHQKDGGVFVRFRYLEGGDKKAALKDLEVVLRKDISTRGGVPTWIPRPSADIWMVRGNPWREDLDRFASPFLKVSFEGPDLQEEALYDILRPYGRLETMEPPTPVPAGALRFSTVHFDNFTSAVVARNAVHGYKFRQGGSQETKLHTQYEAPLKPHAVRDWISNHPRISLPVLLLIIGGLSYTVFDPIRQFTVEGKVSNYFNVKEYRIWKWLKANAMERLPFSLGRKEDGKRADHLWEERKEAENALRTYLADLSGTIAFVHGPKGSGKNSMLTDILHDSNRKYIIIDCNELFKAPNDAALISSLARQTGYWPVFTAFNSASNMIDLISVGMIGQKTGMASTLPEQLNQIFGIVSKALVSVRATYSKASDKEKKSKQKKAARDEADVKETPMWGTESKITETMKDSEGHLAESPTEEGKRPNSSSSVHVDESEAVAGLPIVIINHFASKRGAKEEILNSIATWAASVAENGIAHVVVVSDNREHVKRLTKALPTKPIQTIELFDADSRTSLAFVKQRLEDAGLPQNINSPETLAIQKLGGRASDLESLVFKVRSGQAIEDAVEDIIQRGVSELRKNAFGDDSEDAKSLQWSREQAWALLRKLATVDEVGYYEFLLEHPFSGDESPLRGMEQSELISISTTNGRPSKIRPGRPVYQHVFARLVKDRKFAALQDIFFNEELISKESASIKSCEAELQTIKSFESVDPSSILGGKRASAERAHYLLNKMLAAQQHITKLEQSNKNLKKILGEPS